MPAIWNKVGEVQWQLQIPAVHLWHARNFFSTAPMIIAGTNPQPHFRKTNELQVDATSKNCPTVDYSVSCEIIHLHCEIHGFLIMAERNS